jgi:large exoprotein involved in heme utilization and adhesion
MDGGLIQAGGFPDSSGNAGSLDVQVRRLTLTGGAQLSTSARGRGRGGALRVTAAEALRIAGGGSGLVSETIGSGDAGPITIFAPTLRLEDHGVVAANARGDGQGGAIALEVGTLSLTGGARIDSGTSGGGSGGTVTVTAHDGLTLAGPNSGFFSDAAGSGGGGTLDLRARDIHLTEGAQLSATTSDSATGGDIQLEASGLVQLIDSKLTAFSTQGQEGNIRLNAPLVVLNRSEIRTLRPQGFGGPGGNIRIEGAVFAVSSESVVSASSTLEVLEAVTNLGETVVPLPRFVQVAVLLPVQCAARAQGGRYSSLVLGGLEGLPLEPGGLWPSPFVLKEQLAADPAMSGAPHQQTSAARFALLAGHEKGLPRLGCPP